MIVNAGSIDVIGSHIKAGDHAVLTATKGSINIQEAKETHAKKQTHEEVAVGLDLGVKLEKGSGVENTPIFKWE